MKGLLSDGKTLFLRNVNFHNTGSYSCEVVADSTFLTLIKSAHMQVVGKNFTFHISVENIDLLRILKHKVTVLYRLSK